MSKAGTAHCIHDAVDVLVPKWALLLKLHVFVQGHIWLSARVRGLRFLDPVAPIWIADQLLEPFRNGVALVSRKVFESTSDVFQRCHGYLRSVRTTIHRSVLTDDRHW